MRMARSMLLLWKAELTDMKRSTPAKSVRDGGDAKGAEQGSERDGASSLISKGPGRDVFSSSSRFDRMAARASQLNQ